MRRCRVCSAQKSRKETRFYMFDLRCATLQNCIFWRISHKKITEHVCRNLVWFQTYILILVLKSSHEWLLALMKNEFILLNFWLLLFKGLPEYGWNLSAPLPVKVLNSFRTSAFLLFMYEPSNKLILFTKRWYFFIHGNMYYSRAIFTGFCN
jgi:hypothetical protein